MKIVDVLKHSEPSVLKKGVLRVNGWIRQLRTQSDIIFVNLNDGSCPQGLQIVCNRVETPQIYDVLKGLNIGCYLKTSGNLIDSPAKGQKYELIIGEIVGYSECDINQYPLSKNMKLPALRQLAHYRSKTKTFGCVYRIRNTVMYETHNFFQNKRFLHLDPNIITTNECEGGAGVFTVTEIMGENINNIPHDNKNNIDFNKDHFKKQTYLTVSSQLQLEALACGMGNCYTTNKSFRSEHSTTNKHVSEFTHLEIEMIECNNADLMSNGSNYIKYIIKKVYEKNYDDLVELNKFVCKGLLERYEKLLSLEFVYKTYDECIKIINSYSDINVCYGVDLSSDMEDFLTSHFNAGVFVYNWPSKIKSFYMKQHEDNENLIEPLCENFDLLMPYGIGELIGGSMREHRLEILRANMKMKAVPEEGLEWYLDLRKYGSVEHGGYGLGLDRLIMLLTGITNIKDVIPFPVSYQNCNY